jgi:hypothetical protein
LTVNNEKNGLVSTDSVKINLNAMEFYNKDSLFKLRINNFALDNNAAILKGVSYGPSELNTSKKGINFSAPSFVLDDIDIPELIKGHIKASNAILSQPLILISEPNKTTISQEERKKKSAIKQSNLIRSLHQLNDLIDVAGLDIRDGTIHYQGSGDNQFKIDVNNINAKFQLNEIFEIDQLLDIEHTISWIMAKEVIVSSNDMNAHILNYHFDGTKRMSNVDQFLFNLKNGSEIKGNNLSWKLFDWKYFQKTNRIKMEWTTIDHLAINLKESSERVKTKNSEFPLIDIGNFKVNQFEFFKNSANSQIKFSGDRLQIENLKGTPHLFQWDKIAANIYQLNMDSENSKLSVAKIILLNNQESRLENINFQNKNATSEINIEVPLLRLRTELNSSDFSQLIIPSIYADKGTINYTSLARNENPTTPSPIPFPILIQNVDLNNFGLKYSSTPDSLSLESNTRISGNNWQFGKNENELFGFKNLDINLTSTNFYKKNLLIEAPLTVLQFQNGSIQNNSSTDWSISSNLHLLWENVFVKYAKDSLLLSANQLSGNFSIPNFKWVSGQKIDWENAVNKIYASGENVQFQNKKLSVKANQFVIDGLNKKLSLFDFAINPHHTREEAFAIAKWQKDFMVLKGDSLTVSDIRFFNPADSFLRVRSIDITGVNLDLSRDKRIPFHHGIEKKMPTKLIQSIPFPLKVDSISIRNSKLKYNEFTIGTNHWATIPFREMNVQILNFSTDKNEKDSLSINIESFIFDGPIRRFSYRESYADSLSGFVAENHLSAFDMVHLSKLSHPLAGAFIVRGEVDTLFAKWTGNKYAALGTMNFHYKNLKIKLMDKGDISKHGLMSSVKTFIANLILPNQQKKPYLIYFRRDREKFIFNYWIKTQTSGFLSTLGVKSNRKYRKQYEEDKVKFSLPPNGFP